MASAIDIYLDNLREALKQVQRYMVLGISISLFYFLMVMGGGEGDVTLLASLPPVERTGAEIILLIAYFVSGAMAGWTLERAGRLVAVLKNNKEDDLLAAALTLPSIPTFRIWGPRVGPALIAPLFAIAGFLISRFAAETTSPRDGEFYVGLVITLAVLIVPYALLAIELSKFAGLRPDHVGD